MGLLWSSPKSRPDASEVEIRFILATTWNWLVSGVNGSVGRGLVKTLQPLFHNQDTWRKLPRERYHLEDESDLVKVERSLADSGPVGHLRCLAGFACKFRPPQPLACLGIVGRARNFKAHWVHVRG